MVFLIVATVVSGCLGRNPPGPINVPLLGPTPTPNLGDPDGVANAFLNAWMQGNYEGMYSLLTSNSQAENTLEEFTDIYISTATAMTLMELNAAPLSSLLDTSGTTARVAYHVTYNTEVLGPIDEDLMMNLVIAERRWGISWSPSMIFPQMAGGNTIQLEIETPSRANIYDRNGLALVSADASTVTLSVVPNEISPGVEDQMIGLLATVLRTTPEEIRARYQGQPPDWWIPLGDADSDTVRSYAPALNSYPGIHTTNKTGRRYFDVLAPHILGYTGFIPAEQIDEYKARGYQGDEVVGLSGLEAWGESYLAGTHGGMLSAYTPNGQYFAEIARRDPQPSQSIYTTLDRNLQAIVQDAIQNAFEVGAATWAPSAGGAAVVALDIKTGEVLAIASYPYFDPNILNPNNHHPLFTDSYLADLFNDPRRPFLNRATQGVYPPGSLFKIISMAAAMNSGLFDADSSYTCTGTWTELGLNAVKFDWKEGGHGDITLEQALTGSCNDYFYHVGLVTGEKDPNILPTYARDFGLGEPSGIEIDENSGLVPDSDWLMEQRGEEWKLADSVNIAIGQGDLQVTPLQMASAIAAIANGGTIYKPHLVQRIGLIGEPPSVEYQPEILKTLPLTTDEIESIREGMRGVVADPIYGTAQYRFIGIQMAVAGKTGTAQIGAEGTPPIAWFGGYAPYDDPQIAIVVLVENGGQGSAVAAPIFRRIVEKYYNLTVADYPPDWYDPSIFHFVDDIGE